jgi:hypothetical protein
MLMNMCATCGVSSVCYLILHFLWVRLLQYSKQGRVSTGDDTVCCVMCGAMSISPC